MFGFGRPRPRSQGHGGYGSAPSYFDGYGDGYDGYGLRGTQRQELQLRRRQQAELAQRRRVAQEGAVTRRRQALQEQRDEQARHNEAKARRATALKRYHAAATTIQRAYRAHRARDEMELQHDAALCITDAVRRAASVQPARRITSSLKQLHKTRRNIRSVRAEFEAQPRGYRNTLFFVDSLEKLMFAMDAVATHGSIFVRTFRKAVVNDAQDGLSYADVVMTTMRRKVKVIQKAVRSYQAHGTAGRQDAAAHVITRAVRAAPVVRKARGEAHAMQQLHTKRRRLSTLRKEYTAELQTLVNDLEAIRVLSRRGKSLQADASAEARATLAAVLQASTRTSPKTATQHAA